MKAPIAIGALICAVFVASPASIFAQGSLTPSGAPAPTMKSLDQIEPRTPISSLPFTISTGGSYYLTKSLSVSTGNAITISASGVTLDLNGFTITGTANPAAGIGILLNGLVQDITIHNGHIRGGVTLSGNTYSTGPGFTSGISSLIGGSDPDNVRISNISVEGCRQSGIELSLDHSNGVDHCLVRTINGVGIHAAIVSDCVAHQCGSHGMNVYSATNCYGQCTAGDNGIFAFNAVACTGLSDSGSGVSATSASHCYGTSNGAYLSSPVPSGIYTDTAIDCEGTNTFSGDGVHARNAQNCYGVSSYGTGLFAYDAENCYGASGSGEGLTAESVLNCTGTSSSNAGIDAFTASNSTGTCSTGVGIVSTTASNCTGSTGDGEAISTAIAISCYASNNSSSLAALDCYGVANNCVGHNQGTGPAIQTCIAIGCVTQGGSVNATCGKFLGTP